MDNQKEGMPNWIVLILSLVGGVYLLNPTGGIVEFIPDIIPWVGNLDEATAALLVWQGINRLINNRRSKS